MSFTAVYARAEHGYVGFVEEFPLCVAQGRNLDEARRVLREMLAVVFDAERQRTRDLLGNCDLVREPFFVRSAAAPTTDRA